MTVAALFFWLSLAIILYVYVGYPLVLSCLCFFLKRRVVTYPITSQLLHKSAKSLETYYRPIAALPRWGFIEPKVTVIISAYNEEAVIAKKLDNTLLLDYPQCKLEVIVVSDASSDATDKIVSSYAPRVKLIKMPKRVGKTLGLNRAAEIAMGDILIFSDANALYNRKAVRYLVRNFINPEVGCVTGHSRYYDEKTASVQNETLYWRYEIFLKKLESRLDSIVGGDGAIYALRRTLYEPMAASDLSDFVNPLQVVLKGFRNVFELGAYSIEAASDSFTKEFRRKVRVVNRAWRGVFKYRQALNPLRHGLFAFQLFSHKLLRWCILIFMALAFICNLILINEGVFYILFLLLQSVFYLLAFVGRKQNSSRYAGKIFSIPYYFLMVNWAAIVGIFENFRGNTFVVWDTIRDTSTTTELAEIN